jgi:multicomponent Na+:H+ antiporter subunit C
MAFTSIVIGAAVAALALSLVIYAYRHYGSIDLRRLRRLRW